MSIHPYFSVDTHPNNYQAQDAQSLSLQYVSPSRESAFLTVYQRLLSCNRTVDAIDTVSHLNQFLHHFHQGGPGFETKTYHYGGDDKHHSGIQCLVFFSEQKGGVRFEAHKFIVTTPIEITPYRYSYQ
ncbi:hypothetical protein [Parashewanella tropica]|uniref:hypothetical protein n=1 Tax=Parashewanella tropica TaxID=2547970 RepID=UPI001059BB22|nr:hypothetical protein [Parashewanella tropica]